MGLQEHKYGTDNSLKRTWNFSLGLFHMNKDLMRIRKLRLRAIQILASAADSRPCIASKHSAFLTQSRLLTTIGTDRYFPVEHCFRKPGFKSASRLPPKLFFRHASHCRYAIGRLRCSVLDAARSTIECKSVEIPVELL